MLNFQMLKIITKQGVSFKKYNRRRRRTRRDILHRIGEGKDDSFLQHLLLVHATRV